MPHLSVTYCIVCEDVRPETQGKHAILGFFGLLPNVNIKLKEMGKALARLVYLINVEGDAGKYKFKFSIIGPDGKKVTTDIALPEMEILGDTTKRAMVAVYVVGLIFKKEGSYTIKLSNKNKAFYESSFRVEKGPKELFTS